MAWYVMRDLTRSNCKHPAWEGLEAAGFRVYTPMMWKVLKFGRRKERIKSPVIHDLLFVESTREELDPYVDRCPTLQYRFKRGGKFGEALTVPDAEMERFIAATDSDPEPLYFNPGEVTENMVGRKVRIIGGQLDGYEGHLLSVRGMRKRRLIVELTGMLAVAVEVSPDLISFVD